MSLILNDIEIHADHLKRALFALEILAGDSREAPEPEQLSGLFGVLHRHAESLETCLARYRAELHDEERLAAQGAVQNR